MSKTLTFSIEGPYITALGREYMHEGDFEKAMKLILGCIETDELTKREREHLAFDILNGNADIVGTYPDPDYGIEDYDETRQGTLIQEAFEEMKTQLETVTEKYQKLQEKYNFVISALEEQSPVLVANIEDDYKQQYEPESVDNYCPVSSHRSMLNEYIKRMQMDTDNDYGWLEPDGTFHPVDWGKHAEWAGDFLKTQYPKEKYPDMYWHDLPNQGRKPIETGDVMTYKLGWICIDNPAQGLGRPQKIGKPMTKAQKEFLYGYYVDRHETAEANRIYNEN